MEIDPQTSLLCNVRYIASPNHNQYPDADDISLLVIHNISLPAGQFGGEQVIKLFTNQLEPADINGDTSLVGVEVSAHVFIRRTGEVIQFVPFNKRAWHAGVSSFAGRESCNDFSIGIELEGDDYQAYTEAQYQALAEVTRALLKKYPKIAPERIKGHCDIAPGRKTDPGESFAWQTYWHLLDYDPLSID